MVSPAAATGRHRSSKSVEATRSFAAAISIQRVGTGASRSSRNGSASHRSRSRGASTSIISSKKDDAYHESLFHRAALIRGQLMRSLASASQAVDDAEREFGEDIIERRIRQQKLWAARLVNFHSEQKDDRAVDQAADEVERDSREDIIDRRIRRQMLWATRLVNMQSEQEDDREDINLDYSRIRGEGDAVGPPAPEIDRGSVYGAEADLLFAASQSSSALETESHRLKNPISIFANNSSTSSSDPGVGFRRPSSEKENIRREARRTVNGSMGARVIAMHDVVSPTSTFGLNSPAARDECPGRHFQEDASKPATLGSTPDHSPGDNRAVRNHQKCPPGHGEEALNHARRAGPLWRSLVGNHVRFPSHWETVLPPTSPPAPHLDKKWSKWYYVARHRVNGDKRLNEREFGVRSRRTGGRILMRLVVRKMRTEQACRDIAIGCFHPNSRGIRKGGPSPEAENARELWMAVRWLMATDEDKPTPDLREEGDNYEGAVDNFLMKNKRALDYSKMGSALGHRKAINNENIRAIFGDQPPVTTVDLQEDKIAEILKSNSRKKLADLPALVLLELFLFSK